MTGTWTTADIEAILIQLNSYNLPFEKYALSVNDQHLELLGQGASANVYKAEYKDKRARKSKNGYAIKVIGFGDKHVESQAFRESVDMQMSIGAFRKNIVCIYERAEVYVWIKGEHDVVDAKLLEDGMTINEGNYLHLQFIVMEEITPVLKSNKFGKPLLSPHKLAEFDESEILKVAHDIGRALSLAHNKNLIHRDVKLENIFYSAKEDCYKLGDFGIARTTDDGLASTVAFTKGYGAPEVVGTLDDKYDFTADIYSFGMLLYVLLNELRFPESKNYRPNVIQYVHGFVPPEPVRGKDDICRAVMKMISFDPDDRYQSMDEVLNEIDKVNYGGWLKYKREHKDISLLLGATFSFLGAVLWKISFGQVIDINIATYIFAIACVYKGLSSLLNKKMVVPNIGVFITGIIFLIATGISWPKIILFLYILCFGNIIAGILGVDMILVGLTDYCTVMHPQIFETMIDYRWTAILLISMSCILLLQHYVLAERDEAVTKAYLKRNIFWIVVAAYYLMLCWFNIKIKSGSGFTLFPFITTLLGPDNIDFLMTCNLQMVGLVGLAFSIMWFVRDKVLSYFSEKMEEYYLKDKL